jgi:glycosyltransferase involved in cell wall biosynthesis
MLTHSSTPVPKTHRILISGGLAVGGAQTHVTLLCRVLRETGAELTIVSASTNWPKEAIADLRSAGVRVVVSPFGFGRLKLLGKLWAILIWPFVLRRDYDVLYCLGEGKLHLWAHRFASKNAWKIYHEIVDYPEHNSVVAQVATKMDAIVANSRAVGKKMAKIFDGIPVRTIPFLTARAPMTAPAPRAPSTLLRVAFLGRLAPHKRPNLLIEAWPEWSADNRIGPARLDIYGGDYDDEGKRLQARITELGLQNSIHLHGAYATRDLPQIFAATDLVVLPSEYEGLPLVLVEAMQRGIPVVATSAGGTAELGDDNPDIIITEGTDWNKFAVGVKKMAQRIRAGEIDSVRLHHWAECRYGFERVAAAWREALLTPEHLFAKQSTTAAIL